MNGFKGVIPLLLVLASLAFAQDSGAEQHRRELLEARQAWGRAIEEGDLEKIIAFWSEDVVIFPAGEAAIHGREAVRRYVLRNREELGLYPRVKPVSIAASAAGDLGYTVAEYEWINRDGQAINPGRSVTLWRKNEEGEWKCFLEIHSPSPHKAPEGTRDPSVLREGVEAYQTVFNTRDASALSQFFMEDATMIMGNGPLIEGREDIEAWWRRYFSMQEPERRLVIDVNSVRFVSEGVAVVRVATTTGGQEARGSELFPRRARGTWVLILRDGEWRITALFGLPAEEDSVVLRPSRGGEERGGSFVARVPHALRAFVEAYSEAFNSRNPASLAALYTDDADIIVRNEPVRTGKTAIQEWWRAYFADRPYFSDLEFRVRFSIEDFRMLTPDAVLIDMEAGPVRKVGEGDAPVRKARAAWILVRSGGGWLLSALRVFPGAQDQIIRGGRRSEQTGEESSPEE